ncbi:adenine nucleotide alpha hydrolase family protein [Oceanobacillus jeddahense]|uniref:UspA domain-containing protein n=1 Tax=Oceanobacillus jeddahense TaxID=1462527 RepID=A0ABY5JTC8_9BACI|nr:hypothetical protein [Oceanobacillus jeddahense]UUI02122.1 hypothetical protein NP439_19065 [Oceanobacillus jeddahense]
MTDKILVMVDTESFTPNLFKRAAQLSKGIDAPFEVIFFQLSGEESSNKAELEYTLSEVHHLSKQFGANQIHIKRCENERELFRILKAFINKHAFTQLVTTHIGDSRWEEIIYGSFENFLISKMPYLDLHFLSSQQLKDHNESFERGIYAYLHKSENSDSYMLTFERKLNDDMKGVFFKDVTTDFDSGVFMSLTEELKEYKIINGTAIKK